MAISQSVRDLILQRAEGRQEQKSAESLYAYLNDIMVALDKVDNVFYQITDLRHYKDDDQALKMHERMFAYEFYHQIRQIMGERENGDFVNPLYQGLLLNGEMDKSSHLFYSLLLGKNTEMLKDMPGKKEYDRIAAEYFDHSTKFIPDLILHEAGNLDNQIYIAEIKMEGNPKTLDDLKKLTHLEKGLSEFAKMKVAERDTSFQLYIFIYMGDLEYKVSQVRGPKWKCLSTPECTNPDIVCIYRKDYEFQCKTFGEVLDLASKTRNN